jgi:WD40 repeat protein
MLKDPETLLSDRYNVAPINVYAYQRKITNNSKKLTYAYDVIFMIKCTFEEIQRGLQRYSNILRMPDQKRRLESVGLEAASKGLVRATRIVHKYSKDEKLSSYEDHLDLISDDLKAEKDARFILEELVGIRTVQPITVTKKVGSRLPTGQTTSTVRKETAISQTPSEGFVEQQRVITEPSREVTEGNREFISEPSRVQEYIVSDRDIKPQYHVTRDYDYDMERQAITTKYEQQANGKKYDQFVKGVAKSTMAMPQQRIELRQEEPSSYSRPMTISTTQPESYRNYEMEKLKSEIDSLRRENESLTSKLRESTIMQQSFTEPQQPFSQARIETQPYSPPIIESTQVQEESIRTPVRNNKEYATTTTTRLIEQQPQPQLQTTTEQIQTQLSTAGLKQPIFVRHHIPLKNWNMILKKTVNSSEHQKVKCMEAAQDLECLFSGLINGKLIIWKFINFHSIFEHKVMNISNAPIKSLLYMNDSKTLFCGCSDGKLVKVDLSLFSAKTISDFEAPIVALVNPFNGYSLAVAAGKKILEIDYVNNKILNSIDAHDMDLTDLTYNQQKEILCSGSKDMTVKVWNFNTKECLGILQGHNGIIKSICFAYSKEQTILCSVSKDSYLTLWNLSDKNLTRSIKLPSPASKVFYVWDNRTLVTVHNSGTFSLWNIERDNEKSFFSNKVPYSTGIYFDDGHNIILANREGSLEFWNSK